jgi:hypothetical protein
VLLYELHDTRRFPQVQDSSPTAASSRAPKNRLANAIGPRVRKSARPPSRGPSPKPLSCADARTRRAKHPARAW